MSIHLSPRMLAVAENVPPGARVIDVGTDHAMIPVWLAQTGRARHVWASDLRPGPLRSAAALVSETGTSDVVELRLTDGLNGFCREDGDTVILAGMGGETMLAILSAAAWVREGTLLILEPQSKQAELRRYLTSSGFAITREALVRDAGRIYPILCAVGGAAGAYSEAEYHVGAFSQIARDPLFGEYLSLLMKRAEAAAPYDAAAAALLAEYKTMEVRLELCQR